METKNQNKGTLPLLSRIRFGKGLFIVTSILLFAIGWYVFSRIQACKHPIDVVVNPINLDSLYSEVNHYKTKSQHDAVTINTLTVEKSTFKSTIDSLAKELSIKPKYIKGVTSYTVLTDTVVSPGEKIIDTVNKDTIYRYQDPYLYQSLSTKSGKFTFKLAPDTITSVQVAKEPFFGRASYSTVITNTNKYNKISQGYSIVQYESPIILTIGPSVQATWSFKDKRPVVQIGISAQVPIFKVRQHRK